MMLSKQLVEDVLESYIAGFGLARSQLESFDFFCTVQLPSIIRETPVIERVDEHGTTHSVEFLDVHITAPRTREADGFVSDASGPHETSMRGNSYLSDVLVDIEYTRVLRDGATERRIYTGVEVCKIPMMVGSRFCALRSQYHQPHDRCRVDRGGYFVINSSEKSIICQEKLAINRCFVWKGRAQQKESLVCEIRSCSEHKLRSTSTLTMGLRTSTNKPYPQLLVHLPFVEGTVSIAQVFILLRCPLLKDMETYLSSSSDATPVEKEAIGIVRSCWSDEPREDLVRHLGARGGHTEEAKAVSYMRHIVDCEFLPHIGLTSDADTLERKRFFFAQMIRKTLLVRSGKYPADDRDHYQNKRIDGPGMLVSLLFRQLWRQYLKTTTTSFGKVLDGNKPLNVPDLLKGTKVTSGILYAFSTGSWGVSKSPGDRAGVVQMMNRASFFAVLASLRRINTPVNKDSKSPPVRQLHTSSWGIVCCTETPEGASCGLVKNLALLAHIRVGCTTAGVRDQICKLPGFRHLVDGCSGSLAGGHVIVNGQILGAVPDTRAGLEKLRAWRTSGLLPFDTTVAQLPYADGIEIDTDPGALCRPVFRTSKIDDIRAIYRSPGTPGVRRLLFKELQERQCIVYLEKKEEATATVALDAAAAARDHTEYFEIHPLSILGLCANMIPFPEFNQAPRNTYQAAMGKQALGLPASNIFNRYDTVTHVLHNPHVPIVDTKISEFIGTPVLPSGQSLIVAIMAYSGYNQEDSIIVSAGAIERGMGRCDVYRTHRYDIPLSGQENFHVTPPPPDCPGRKFGDYTKLGARGWPEVGTEVVNGDILIGVVMKSKQEIRDCSISYRYGPAVVDAVWECQNKEGKLRVCVRTREHRLPRPGDKFSSRHGQKGVIGRVMADADMPYRQDGLGVDIIVNPHAIPSRMTIGHLLETEVGTTACMLGMHADGTAFQQVDVNEIAKVCGDVVEEHGGSDVVGKHCDSTMVCGISGEVLATRCFVGVTWYQKLKHMVRDKQHSRTTGPVAIMTRQPLEGRSRGGGLRFGEMEVQCLLAYGAAKNAREILYNKSDPFKAYYCRTCGRLAEPPCTDRRRQIVRSKRAFCRNCDSFSHISRVEIPYCGKLFLQLLQAGNVEARLQIVPDARMAR